MSALSATSIFWLSLAVGASIAFGIGAVFLGEAGGSEWGGVGSSLVSMSVVSVIGAILAVGLHAAAILVLRRMFPAAASSLRDGSCAVAAVAVLVVGALWQIVLDQDGTIPDWALRIVIGPVPFVLTLLVVPLVGRLRTPDAQANEQ